MKQNYLKDLSNIQELCKALREEVESNYYKKDGSLSKWGRDGVFCFYPEYRELLELIKGAVGICDLFGIKLLERKKPILDQKIVYLEDHVRLRKSKDWFDTPLGVIEGTFESVKDEIDKKIALLEFEEKDRVNESMHCFVEGCYYSAVAMAVSAIEFRLFSLMTSANPTAKLEKLTLGELIQEYLNNKQKYDNAVPKKHKPLLEHCNIYRIFSVHPKKEEINKPIAGSILNMTLMFLLDKNTKIKSS